MFFFGDGAVDEGGFWESVNAASLFKLPVFFVCEDNGWAVHTPPELHQGYSSLADVARLFNCHFAFDDSGDVESIYAKTQSLLAKTLAEPRPVLMHIKCSRTLEHVGIFEDWEIGYRSDAERMEWQAKDSLQIQKARLLSKGVSSEDIAKVEMAIDDGVRHSVERAAQSPIPLPTRLHYGVFHEEA